MTRHRGTYKPDNTSPYELSRSRIENLIKCEACFWLDRAKGVKFPGMPGFLLNSNTDILLKKDFDKYRGKTASPIMESYGLDYLRPFYHKDLRKWENSLHFGLDCHHFNTIHEKTNILLGGGIDDVWENIQSGELHVVDYKSTAQMSKTPKPLDESFIAQPEDEKQPDYKASYRRQMEIYQWLLRRKGFNVSNTGFFVYVDGQHINETGMIDNVDSQTAWMKFNTAIIKYEGDDVWVEKALYKAKETLQKDICPEHTSGCEFKLFIDGVIQAKTN